MVNFISLTLGAETQMRDFYSKAMPLGEASKGALGRRKNSSYAAYFHDADGNQLNAFCLDRGDSLVPIDRNSDFTRQSSFCMN
tara:strand:- start:20527 stop:20775 length:249 start_codon:yes stop_codon:yes gene_type:complete